MKEQYDFGKRISLKENRMVTDDFSNAINQYDFLLEDALWGSLAKSGFKLANNSYTGAALRGAGAGATVGALGNMAHNFTKRDDDPTKQGVVGSMFSGAKKGAAAGAGLGLGARIALRTDLGKAGLEKAAKNAMQGMDTAAKTNFAKELNRGAGEGFWGKVIDSRRLGVNAQGDMIRGIKNLRSV